MTLPISTRSKIRFQPDGSPTVYHLRVPDILDEEDYNVELVASGFRWRTEDQMIEALIGEFRSRATAPGQFDDTIAMLEDVRAFRAVQAEKPVAEREPLEPEIQTLLEEAERQVLRISFDYRRIAQERVSAINRMYIVAVRMFLVGWDEGPLPFATDFDGRISDACMRAIPKPELLEVGMCAHGLMKPSETERKNLPSLSRSRKSPAASPATAPQTAAKAGSSTEQSSPTTRRGGARRGHG